MSQTTDTRRPDPKLTPVLTARVTKRVRLSPSFARITLGGEGLGRLEVRGFDHWFRMFMPLADPTAPTIVFDDEPGWYARYLAAPDAERPTMRYVTVSARRHGGSHGSEIDVDVVLHGSPGEPGTGPLSNWAQSVEPGETVGILDQGVIFKPDQVEGSVILIGDETAVPAVAGILRSLPPGTRGEAFLEVPQRADVQALHVPEGVELTWLPRSESDAEAHPGESVLAAGRRALELSAGHPYVYAAGESRMAKALGVALRDEFEWPQHRFTTVGYWHHAARDHD
ncbi:MAG: siderophore-interacting protein [Trueperaceae bacterium]|nr:siderophore-interacting protein [Trueperaceae bacterium]